MAFALSCMNVGIRLLCRSSNASSSMDRHSMTMNSPIARIRLSFKSFGGTAICCIVCWMTPVDCLAMLTRFSMPDCGGVDLFLFLYGPPFVCRTGGISIEMSGSEISWGPESSAGVELPSSSSRFLSVSRALPIFFWRAVFPRRLGIRVMWSTRNPKFDIIHNSFSVGFLFAVPDGPCRTSFPATVRMDSIQVFNWYPVQGTLSLLAISLMRAIFLPESL